MKVKDGRSRAALTRRVGTDARRRSTRRAFLGACALLAVAPGLALAQARRDVPLVAVLYAGSPESHALLYEAFRSGMREAGLREGENVRIEIRWARGQNDRFAPLAEELVKLQPAVIVTASTPALLAAAKAAQGHVAIVMASADDPTLFGLAQSFARPGGNVTGTVNLLRDLDAKQMELLRLIKPGLRRVGLLENPANRISVERMRNRAARMRELGASPTVVDASTAEELRRAFERLAREGAEALVVDADAFFLIQRELIAQLAIARKLPTLNPFREMVDDGGLMSYGVGLPYSYHRASYFVHRVLKGAKPAELPIEQPTQVELVLNRRTARALGVAIPGELLLRADKVIE